MVVLDFSEEPLVPVLFKTSGSSSIQKISGITRAQEPESEPPTKCKNMTTLVLMSLVKLNVGSLIKATNKSLIWVFNL
jgi:hypothetical protein